MPKHMLHAAVGVLAALAFSATICLAAESPNLAVSVVASTVPANGDVNPYGVAIVPVTKNNLHAGHILVSNFNNVHNLQGTGTTIVDISPGGTVSLFAQINAASLPGACPGGVGLTTALVVLRSGWVIVGSLPTSDGTSATAQAGCLIVLDSTGKPVETISGSLINGPWDMTALDAGFAADLFVTNVLNGTVAAGGAVVNEGTVVRIVLGTFGATMPSVQSITVIGAGFPERTDPAALVIGPTGVGLNQQGVLYVADSLSNRIAAIPNAVLRQLPLRLGTTVSEGGSLNDPLGVAIEPLDGNIVTLNGNDGLLIITRPNGSQAFRRLLDASGMPPGAGALFGLAFAPEGLYYVDDATNTLNILH